MILHVIKFINMVKLLCLISVIFVIIYNSKENEIDKHRLCTEIKTLSSILTMTLNTLPAGGGYELLYAMDKYNDKLRELVILAQQNRKGLNSTIANVLKEGKPLYLRDEFSDGVLKSAFNWTDFDINLMYELRMTSFNYWDHLQKLMANIT